MDGARPARYAQHWRIVRRRAMNLGSCDFDPIPIRPAATEIFAYINSYTRGYAFTGLSRNDPKAGMKRREWPSFDDRHARHAHTLFTRLLKI